MPGFAEELGHGDPGVAYTSLLAADAAGALLGGFLLESRSGILPTRSAAALKPSIGWAASLLALRWSARTSSRCRCCSLGFFELSFSSMAQTIVQMNAPDALRGRVLGVFAMASSGLRTFSGVTVGLAGSVLDIHFARGGVCGVHRGVGAPALSSAPRTRDLTRNWGRFTRARLALESLAHGQCILASLRGLAARRSEMGLARALGARGGGAVSDGWSDRLRHDTRRLASRVGRLLLLPLRAIVRLSTSTSSSRTTTGSAATRSRVGADRGMGRPDKPLLCRAGADLGSAARADASRRGRGDGCGLRGPSSASRSLPSSALWAHSSPTLVRRRLLLRRTAAFAMAVTLFGGPACSLPALCRATATSTSSSSAACSASPARGTWAELRAGGPSFSW